MAGLLSLALPGSFLAAQAPWRTGAPVWTPHRVLVKLRAPLAQSFEAVLPAQAGRGLPDLPEGTAGRRFLSRHAARTWTPLYPGLIRQRKAAGWSEAQLGDQLRQAYPRRTARLASPTPLPEVSRTYVLEVAEGATPSLAALVAELAADPEVEFAEPEHLVRVNSLPNDPYLASTGSWGMTFPDLWGLLAIKAPEAWAASTGVGIVVAVVDTGLDYRHPDLAANVWRNPRETAENGLDDDGNGYVDDVRGWDFVGASSNNPAPGNDPIDRYGHGTHVAGIIAAVGNNGLGVIGVAPGAKVMALKALDDLGTGSDVSVAGAILYAARNGADVINASWSLAEYSRTLAEAVQYAYSLGVLVVVSAGNESRNVFTAFPANMPEVVTVAASTPSGGVAGFCSFGSKIDVMAPGQDILSLRAANARIGRAVGDDYAVADGTSMAAPHVAGLAALFLAAHPHTSVETFRQVLRATASRNGGPGWDPDAGAGLVNAQQVLAGPKVLQARITSPLRGVSTQTQVTVTGLAQGAGFDHFVLDFGAGLAPARWTVLRVGNAPVAGDVLGSFDPGLVADGLYTIRLTVFDGSGQTFTDRIELFVKYVAITSPARPFEPGTAMVFKPGAQLPVIGSALGASFQGFRLQWAEGILPAAGWRSDGLTPTGGGRAPLDRAQLGVWDTSGITKAGYVTLRVQVDNAGFTSQAETVVYLEPDLLSQAWPKPLRIQDGGWNLGFVPVLDASGKTRLAIESGPSEGEPNRRLLQFSPAGALLATSPLGSGASSLSNPTAWTRSGQSGQDLLTVGPGLFVNSLHPDGSATRYEASVAKGYPYFPCSPLVVNGLAEGSGEAIVAMGSVQETQMSYLYAWRPDGSLLGPNFPLAVPTRNVQNSFNNYAQNVLVGDLDGDGRKEFVAVEGCSENTYTLRLFDQDGVAVSWPIPVFTGSIHGLALADLDNNGKLEILLIDSGTAVHVFQPNGTERPGWPKEVVAANKLVVCDLERNGNKKIVVHGMTKLEVLNTDGTTFSDKWPLAGSFGSNIVIADIDDDGFPEIIVEKHGLIDYPRELDIWKPALPVMPGLSYREANLNYSSNYKQKQGVVGSMVNNYEISMIARFTNTIVALRLDGSPSKTWELSGMGNALTAETHFTVGDFDQDGTVDIAMANLTTTGDGAVRSVTSGVVRVLSTGSHFNVNVSDWPMSNHDPQNSSILGGLCLFPGVSPDAAVGHPYSEQLVAAAGQPPYGFFLAAGRLPNGLSLSAEGLLSGIPREAGRFRYRVELRDASGGRVANDYSLQVHQAAIEIPVAAAGLLPGLPATYSATVTGTDDTSVLWTASGGTLVVSGTSARFSASAPGVYTLTATSAAEGITHAVITVQVHGCAFADPESGVGGQDALTLIGKLGTTDVAVDLDGNGRVDGNDLALLLNAMEW